VKDGNVTVAIDPDQIWKAEGKRDPGLMVFEGSVHYAGFFLVRERCAIDSICARSSARTPVAVGFSDSEPYRPSARCRLVKGKICIAAERPVNRGLGALSMCHAK
jgi:hypothetical protein